MSRPIRIQRRRAKGWKMPPGTVYVGRPTKWGNPYQVGDHERSWQSAVVEAFKVWLRDPEQSHLVSEARRELHGKNLVCWCALGTPCHADHWLEIANSEDRP